jgi:hypothetical protein
MSSRSDQVCPEQVEGACNDAASTTTAGGPSIVGCGDDLLGTHARRHAEQCRGNAGLKDRGEKRCVGSDGSSPPSWAPSW